MRARCWRSRICGSSRTSRARWSRARTPPAYETRRRRRSRSPARRRRLAPPARHRRAGHAARQGEGTDSSVLLFERRSRAAARADARRAVRRMTTRGVTIVVHADGDLESKQYRLPRWALMAGKWGAGAIAVLVVLFFAFAGPISRNAARVPALEREVSRLRVENSRVQQLASALNRAEANYQELRQMLGVRAPPVTRAGAGGAVARNADFTGLMRAVAIRAARPGAGTRFETGGSVPSHWPLDVQGFVTRGQVRPGVVDESHPGIDIAVPLGTPVRASGGGSV